MVTPVIAVHIHWSAVPGNMNFIGIHSGGPYSNTKRSVWSMLVFVVTVSYKVAVSPGVSETAQLLLQEMTRLGSCQPLVTFSSADQHILFRESLCNVYC